MNPTAATENTLHDHENGVSIRLLHTRPRQMNPTQVTWPVESWEKNEAATAIEKEAGKEGSFPKNSLHPVSHNNLRFCLPLIP